MKRVIVLLAIFSFHFAVSAQDPSMFEKKNFIHKGDTLRYRILYPDGYDASKTYPLVLFLHGAGERGSDNESQLTHGASLFLNKANRDSFPAIVVFPQCPKDQYWSNVKIEQTDTGRIFNFQNGGEPTQPMKLLLQFVEYLEKKEHITPQRMYVGGLSMGGMGTFELLARKPKTFVAAFPICGGGSPAATKKYAKRVNLWIFHGEKDEVVKPSYSREMAAALQNHGANVKLTIYPEANHNSWDPAFSEPTLLSWLFAQMK